MCVCVCDLIFNDPDPLLMLFNFFKTSFTKYATIRIHFFYSYAYENSDKTELTGYKQDGVISTLNGKPLKSVDQFIYLGSNISSTESDFNIGKAWTTVDRLLLHHLDFSKTPGEKGSCELNKDAVYYIEQILEAAPYKIKAVWSLISHLTTAPPPVRRPRHARHCWRTYVNFSPTFLVDMGTPVWLTI